MSTTTSTGDSPAVAPFFVPYARLPVWRRVLVMVGLTVLLVIWVPTAVPWSPNASLLVTCVLPVVAAMGLSIVNHPAAQLVCRGVAWFQLLFGVAGSNGSFADVFAVVAMGAGLALLAMGDAGLTMGEETRGSFAPVALRRSLMAALVMAIAEIQGLSEASGMMASDMARHQHQIVAMLACAVVLTVGVVGLYRLRVWGLVAYLVAMVGMASIAAAAMPRTTSEMDSLFVWFVTIVVRLLAPLPMLLAIVSRRVGAPTPSPWPLRLFQGLVVVMMLVAFHGGRHPHGGCD